MAAMANVMLGGSATRWTWPGSRSGLPRRGPSGPLAGATTRRERGGFAWVNSVKALVGSSSLLDPSITSGRSCGLRTLGAARTSVRQAQAAGHARAHPLVRVGRVEAGPNGRVSLQVQESWWGDSP